MCRYCLPHRGRSRRTRRPTCISSPAVCCLALVGCGNKMSLRARSRTRTSDTCSRWARGTGCSIASVRPIGWRNDFGSGLCCSSPGRACVGYVIVSTFTERPRPSPASCISRALTSCRTSVARRRSFCRGPRCRGCSRWWLSRSEPMVGEPRFSSRWSSPASAARMHPRWCSSRLDRCCGSPTRSGVSARSMWHALAVYQSDSR